jgi:hypothetical protein
VVKKPVLCAVLVDGGHDCLKGVRIVQAQREQPVMTGDGLQQSVTRQKR